MAKALSENFDAEAKWAFFRSVCVVIKEWGVSIATAGALKPVEKTVKHLLEMILEEFGSDQVQGSIAEMLIEEGS